MPNLTDQLRTFVIQHTHDVELKSHLLFNASETAEDHAYTKGYEDAQRDMLNAVVKALHDAGINVSK